MIVKTFPVTFRTIRPLSECERVAMKDYSTPFEETVAEVLQTIPSLILKEEEVHNDFDSETQTRNLC